MQKLKRSFLWSCPTESNWDVNEWMMYASVCMKQPPKKTLENVKYESRFQVSEIWIKILSFAKHNYPQDMQQPHFKLHP